jgi:hypothetical protein
MFKRGTQDSLLSYISGAKAAVEGSFYLTTDTNRLYVGKLDPKDNKVKAVPVNQGVVNVANLAALKNISAEAGQFYYVSNVNVLCVWNGQEWVQINPDTNTYVTERTISSESGTRGSGSAQTTFPVIKDVVVQQEESGGELSAIKEEFISKFAVEGVDGVNVTVETYTDANNKTYPRLVISQEAYTLKSSVSNTGVQATITLTDGTATDSIKLKAGDNVSFSETTSDEEITINAKNTTLNSSVTGSMASNSLTFDANGALTSTVTDSDGNSVSDNVTPIISYAPDDDGTATQTAAFKNGTAALSVYSKAQIDAKLRGLDAMTYKGTVGTSGAIASLPSINDKIAVGDTYKFVSEDSIGLNDVKPGDLVIARGTEGSDGYIASGLTWDIVPSGNDAMSDTTYWMETIAAGAQLMENDTGNGANKGGIQLVDKDTTESSATTYLTIANDTTSAVGDKNKVNKVVIKHKEQSGITAAGKTDAVSVDQEKSQDITVKVPVLSYDKAGHITKVEEKTYKILDTKFEYDLEYLKTTAATTTTSTDGTLAAEATIEASLLDKYTSLADKANFKITSSSLTLNVSGDNLVMDIEWGSF